MIVKIWPIKADYAGQPDKVGGTEGLKNTLDYISDIDKVIVKQDDLGTTKIMQEIADEEDLNDLTGNTTRVIEYMANEDKIKGKYISGYMCNPENALSEFDMARALTLAQAGEKREKEDGAIAFHIVQSFAEGLDISDEEVHQCGLELCEKINAHQAVICSHVHPAVDEQSGEVHGRCKHNHILINAYIHPDKIDPKHPNRLKYNDCKETYALLRQWNDEIAIDHGLPIIRNPDNEKTYSWIETDAVNKGLSWKERIRLDIEAARRLSASWEEFVSVLEKSGYKIREGKDITYTAPDGEHKARGSTLGKQYTKNNLELYWSIRSYSEKAVEEAIRDNTPSPLLNLIQNTTKELFANIPIGTKSQDRQSMYYLPLKDLAINRSALETYFDSKELYEISDADHHTVSTFTGAEIISCIESLADKEMPNRYQYRSPEEEYEEEIRKKRYFTCYKFPNTKTHEPYRTSLYDNDGRRRSTMELLFILAITVIKNENDFWKVDPIPEGHENEVLYADTNWKIQNMLDAMYIANSEGIETIAQLERRLNDAGAAYSRAKSALKKTTRSKDKMVTLHQAVTEYNKTKDLAQRLLELPDGPEKTELQEQHRDVIRQYKDAKAVMYRFGVTQEHQVDDFMQRYDAIQESIKELEERLDETAETYRKLKKLHYNTTLTENAQYCYGPDYSYEKIFDPAELAQRQAQTEAEKERIDEEYEKIQQEEDRDEQYK